MRAHHLEVVGADQSSPAPASDPYEAIKCEYEMADAFVAAIEQNCNTLSKLYMREKQRREDTSYISDLEQQLGDARRESLSLRLSLTDRDQQVESLTRQVSSLEICYGQLEA